MRDFHADARMERETDARERATLTAEQNARWADELPTLPYIGAWRRYLCTSESGRPTRSASTADVAPAAVAVIAALEVPALHTSGQPTLSPPRGTLTMSDLDKSLAHLVQAMRRHVEAKHAELAAQQGSAEVKALLVPRAEKRTNAAAIVLDGTCDDFAEQVRALVRQEIAAALAPRARDVQSLTAEARAIAS